MAEQACGALAKTWKCLQGVMDRIKQEKPTLHRLVFVCAGGMLAGTAALVTIFVLLIGTPIFLLFLPLLVNLGVLAVLFIGGILVFVLASSSPLAWLLEVATFGAEAMIHTVTGNFAEIFTGNVGSHVASIVTNAAGGVKNVAVAVSDKTSQAVGGVAGTAMAITGTSSVIATCVVENTGKALEIETTAVTGGVLELGSSVTDGVLEFGSSVAGRAIGLGLSVTGTVTELGSNVLGGLAGLFHPSGDKSSSRKKKNTGSERHS
ncbi:hypothetical protein SELMODRAFT_416403 [Selaginella moellendorffii]|uniref:Oleosin n=1 Tax=Selaginella moellendorffii TaxID=88036 RepID=D8RZ65_SELML|nr:hypothetical protein SELMODRAFT_416403 [Selaginella moellendorffii]